MIQMINTLSTALLAAQDAVTPATFWMPEGASTVSADVDWAFMFVTWVSYFFFALIVGLMIVFVIRYRHRKGERFRTDGMTHHGPLEALWIIIPLLISIAIFFFGFKGYLDLAQPPKNTFDIEVVAKKWQWSFTYPNGAISTNMDGLFVPAGKPVRLIMRSYDVLHAFFVPNFRVKRDVVPGRRVALWFQCDFPTGEDASKAYNFFCAEYCGTGHSNMGGKVYVLGETEFAEWMAKQANWIEDIPDDQLYQIAGPKLYAQCSQCHTLDGSTGQGPSWKGIMDRISAGTGKFTNGQSYAGIIGPGKVYETPEDYIRDSILNPGRYIVQTFTNVMPTFKGQMNERKIDAVIGLMKHLDQFDSKGKLLSGTAAK